MHPVSALKVLMCQPFILAGGYVLLALLYVLSSRIKKKSKLTNHL